MLTQLITIMGFQLAGEAVATTSGLILPGPLWGLLLFFAYLQLRGGPSQEMAATGAWLIDHLGLLFVPAGAAIMSFGAALLADATAIAVALVLSTCLGILVSGLVGDMATNQGETAFVKDG